MAYLDLAAFKKASIMPSAEIDALNTSDPDFLPARLEQQSRWIDSRLCKRYVAPFDESDPPTVVLIWLEALVTLDAYMRRGFSPASAEDQLITSRAADAKAEVKEAADSQNGLFGLPLRQSDPTGDGVTRGGPLGYSEQSPYTWMDLQVADGAAEDASNTS